MSRYLLLFVVVLIGIQCTKKNQNPQAEKVDLFDELWDTFDREYAAFDVLGKDWDAIGAKYKPLLNENSTDQDLFNIFRSMLFELEDGHADLHTESDLGAIQYYYEITEQAPRNYIGWLDLQRNHLEEVVETTERLAYGKVRDSNIGYLRLRDFSGELSSFSIAKDLLDKYSNLDGVIIDVRNNEGGSEINAREIAGRFTRQETKYRYAKVKNGEARNQLTDFQALSFPPIGTTHFSGPVVLLTNKRTFSAAEDFTLMMKALPQVTHIGDHTWGGFATGPSKKTLSNGWRYRVSRKISYNLQQEPIVGGIVPDESVSLTPEHESDDFDRIMARAIAILKK